MGWACRWKSFGEKLVQQIIDAYAATTARTLQEWAAHPQIGAAVPIDLNRQKLGVSSGRNFSPTGALQVLHAELLQLAADDPLLDVVPAHGLHFTFLALAWDYFDSLAELPPETAQTVAIFKETVAGLNFTVRDLRLVPLKGALLLAGIPTPESFARREALAQRLLQSNWRPYLEARYAGLPIPPLFWHITLVRYGAAYLPQPLRDLYHRYRTTTFDDLALGEPEIGAINFNWTTKILL